MQRPETHKTLSAITMCLRANALDSNLPRFPQVAPQLQGNCTAVAPQLHCSSATLFDNISDENDQNDQKTGKNDDVDDEMTLESAHHVIIDQWCI